MKTTYETPTLVANGNVADVTLGPAGVIEPDGTPGGPMPLGSVGFML